MFDALVKQDNDTVKDCHESKLFLRDAAANPLRVVSGSGVHLSKLLHGLSDGRCWCSEPLCQNGTGLQTALEHSGR